MKQLAVQFRDVHFRYVGGTEPLLLDVNFYVEEGRYVGIIGGNGSGKTTLLRLLLGLLRPDKGEIRLFNQPIREFREWDSVGYVSQHVFRQDRVFPATVLEIVESGHLESDTTTLCQFGMKDCAPAIAALRVASVEHLAKRRIGDLSGGERQRVFIARALVSRPKLLILDEPTANVDLESQEKFYALLKALNHEFGMTIILVSHDLDRVFEETGEVFLLEHGVMKERHRETERPVAEAAPSTATSFHSSRFHTSSF
jgi:zinc transport system ATP-binding protein